MKFLNKIDDVLSKIAIYFVRVLLVVIVLGMLVVNSVYLYSDMPAFRMNNVLNYVGIIINAIVFILLAFLTKLWHKKYVNWILLLLYFVAEIVFLYLVPIRPFSDMKEVVQVAFSNFSEGIEYLQRNPNNLPIALIFNVIARMTVYDVWVLKIFNGMCNCVIIYFSYRLYENVYGSKNQFVFILGMLFIAPFLYTNMIYNDVIATMLIVICLYLVTKNKQRIEQKIWIPILLFLQFIIRPVGIVAIIAVIMYYLFQKKVWQMVVVILFSCLILNFGYAIVENKILPKSGESQAYPIWSYLQMGLNETEFGFQDNSHSKEWGAEDVINRILELGPVRLIKLLVKKEFWMWTEGTYQAERYAFGVGEVEQFYYDTFLTKQLYDIENSDFRNGLDYVMKGQYFFMMLLSLVDLCSRDISMQMKQQRDLLLYLIVGIFCFYVVWEIKSRYIFCLYPIFLVMASSGMQKVVDKIKERKEKKNGKI